MKDAVIIFVRNPELGKVKTRLAATVGDEEALNIYALLLNHTMQEASKVAADKFVYYHHQLLSVGGKKHSHRFPYQWPRTDAAAQPCGLYAPGCGPGDIPGNHNRRRAR